MELIYPSDGYSESLDGLFSFYYVRTFERPTLTCYFGISFKTFFRLRISCIYCLLFDCCLSIFKNSIIFLSMSGLFKWSLTYSNPSFFNYLLIFWLLKLSIFKTGSLILFCISLGVFDAHASLATTLLKKLIFDIFND